MIAFNTQMRGPVALRGAGTRSQVFRSPSGNLPGSQL